MISPSSMALSVFALLLYLWAGASPSRALAAEALPETPRALFHKMSSMPSDNCSQYMSPESTADLQQYEDRLFRAINVLVVDRLNSHPPAQAAEAASRAGSALREVEQASAEINKTWPTTDRFHFEVLALRPAILVQTTYRDQVHLVLFGVYNLNKNSAVDPGTKWREVHFIAPEPRISGINVFPLHRGPSGRLRFLAKIRLSGCAGALGQHYEAYEWGPEAGQLATQIIKIEGAEGLDDDASKHVGKLSTEGAAIQ
ncbi:MAG: hypothetical protein M3N05_02350, partial [Pseudomonadota bacterium]|nr:hypothetical protein [Pseudomonadota bacterium]